MEGVLIARNATLSIVVSTMPRNEISTASINVIMQIEITM